MRWYRARWSAWAARLGVLALVLNAVVPVHLAFDLAEALEPAHHGRPEAGEDIGRRLIALISLHLETDDEHGRHRGHHQSKPSGTDCPVCGALASLGSFAFPATPALSLPVAITASADPLAGLDVPIALFPAGYRSRAPPLA